MTTKSRLEINVSALPTTAYGHREVVWWGTIVFMLIEGTTLAICAASYLYLRGNFEHWPPLGTPLPDLGIPTANLILLLFTLVPMRFAERAAYRKDLGGVRRALVIATLLSLGTVVLRLFEFRALHTRWDSDAYGSIVWMTLGFHASLLIMDFVETAALTAIMFVAQVEDKHFVDTTDNAFYTYFMVLVWIPVYLLIFLGPRVL